MMLDTALFLGRTVAVSNKPMPEFAGWISSLRNSWAHAIPHPFDTVSAPEVRVSVKMTPEVSPAKWLERTMPELARLLWLPKDWSSDNPERINLKAIEKMLELLLAILEPDSPAPIVVPTTRGGVQVEWHQNGIDLEIEATSSGTLEFFFSGPRGDKEGLVRDDPTDLKQYTRYLNLVPTRHE